MWHQQMCEAQLYASEILIHAFPLLFSNYCSKVSTLNSSLVHLFSERLIQLIFSHRYCVITLLFSLHRSIIVAILIFDVFVAPASGPCPELMSSWSIFSTLTTLFSQLPNSCYSVLFQDYLILYPGKINRHVLLELLIL